MTTETIEQTNQKTSLQPPKFYKVMLHNDDTTTMDFVIAVLVKIFHRKMEEAYEVTMNIHENGEGIAGSPYTREIAEEKSAETVKFARANGYPLVATYEEL